MAVGDNEDIKKRLLMNMPPWFGTDHALVSALLQAYVGYVNQQNSTTLYFHYNAQVLYSMWQMRIQTATGDNLDLIAQDYLGNGLPRKSGENDDTYRKRILANILRPRATRSAMASAIHTLTGYEPAIYEPSNLANTGALNVPSTLGLNVYGGLGTDAPYQAWITVYLNSYRGMANFPGLNTNYFGLGISGQLGSPSLEDALVSEEDVIELINATKVFGTKIHTTFVYVN